jgi:epothilone polyketide synthase D
VSADPIVELELDYEPEGAPPEMAWLGRSPFGTMLELVLHAAEQARPGASLADLSFLEPLRFERARRCVVQVDRERGTVRVSSSEARGQSVAHLSARLSEASVSGPIRQAPPATSRVPNALFGEPSLRAWVEPRALALLDAALRGEAVSCFERIAIETSGWTAQLKADAPWDAHYTAHPAVLEEVWHLASAFWASRGLPGARPLLARELRVLQRGARIERIEIRELQGLRLLVELHTKTGVACTFVELGSDAAAAVSTDAPSIEKLARRDLRAELAGRSSTARLAWCKTTIEEVLAELIGCSASELSPDLTFRDLGLKSIDAIRISVALCHALALPPASTLLFDHPTIEQLAAHLVGAEPTNSAGRPLVATASTLRPDSARRAPLAIVGIGCRMPGEVRDAQSFWRFVREGKDALGPLSAARRALVPGFADKPWKVATVDEIEQFDARFFDMPEAEALAATPAQRLLLETTWHALEHAGIVPSSLGGSATSVYVSGALPEYSALIESRNAYAATGNAPSVLAGRLSYALGLQGASVVVDTACSSSAVALCLACDDLRAGTSDLALVGGVNLMLDPRTFEGLLAASVLSEQGRCAAFDESADGYARGEACCVVALRTLDEAQRRGERVIAVVREYGVGHGGHSAGLAAPRREALVALTQDVLQRGTIDPKDVGYVEAHGTGTRVGDAIELQVLADTYGASSKRAEPVWIGSVKTNFGHTEYAAGLVGIVKAALAVQQREIPMHLHFENPNAGFDWTSGGLAIPMASMPWPESAPQLLAVNSFGISGTYAHVILERAPQALRAHDPPASGPCLVPISARGPRSLRALAAAYARHVRSGGSIAALAKAASMNRERWPLRTAVVGASAAAIAERLEAVAANDLRPPPNARQEPTIAFLFPGQGVQAAGIGRELYAAQPAFREAFDACAAIAYRTAGLALHEQLERSGDATLTTDLAQPLIFSIEWAMTRLLASWGVVPRYVMGHSLGEYVAACVAGVFELDDALRLVIERGRLMQASALPGAMLVIEASREQLAALLESSPAPLEVASINAPSSFTLSGPAPAVAACLEQAARLGLRAQRLRVDQAFHSRAMDPVLAPFERAVAGVRARDVSDKLVSNVTGELAGPELCEPSYWRDHVRKPVQLMKSIRTLVERGVNVFVEVGPRSVLLASAARCVEQECRWVPTLRAQSGAHATELEQLLQTCASLFEAGAPVDLQSVNASLPSVREAPFDDIPLYAFDRKRFWPAHARSSPARAPSIEYELSWLPRPLPAPEAPSASSGPWLLVGRDHPMTDALARALSQRTSRKLIRLRPDALGSLASLGAIDRVVCVFDEEHAHDEVESVVRSCAVAARWVRAVQAMPNTRLAFVTLGGQQVVGEARDAFASALASFARVATFEHPDSVQGIFDLPLRPTPRDLHALAAALASADGEDQCAIRNGERFAARIVAGVECLDRGAFKVRADAAYCITGGFGHIGLHVARWLVERGARHIVLIARGSAELEPRASALRALRAAGACASSFAVDVGDVSALRNALERIELPIAAVFHAAGIPGDCAIEDLDENAVRTVLQGKAVCGRALCELMSVLNIEHVVMFSSLAAVLSGLRHAAYAAANGYLDALAASYRIQGQRVQSVLWGPWAGGGMSEVGSTAWAAGGLPPLEPSVALAVLERTLTAGVDQRICVDADWTALRGVFELNRKRPIFGELGLDVRASQHGSDLVRTLLQLPNDERLRALRSFLSAEIASLAGDREVWYEPDADITAVVGLDSLALVQLRGRIRATLGLLLSPSLLIEQRSVSALAAAIDELLRAPSAEDR